MQDIVKKLFSQIHNWLLRSSHRFAKKKRFVVIFCAIFGFATMPYFFTIGPVFVSANETTIPVSDVAYFNTVPHEYNYLAFTVLITFKYILMS